MLRARLPSLSSNRKRVSSARLAPYEREIYRVEVAIRRAARGIPKGRWWKAEQKQLRMLLGEAAGRLLNCGRHPRGIPLAKCIDLLLRGVRSRFDLQLWAPLFLEFAVKPVLESLSHPPGPYEAAEWMSPAQLMKAVEALPFAFAEQPIASIPEALPMLEKLRAEYGVNDSMIGNSSSRNSSAPGSIFAPAGPSISTQAIKPVPSHV